MIDALLVSQFDAEKLAAVSAKFASSNSATPSSTLPKQLSGDAPKPSSDDDDDPEEKREEEEKDEDRDGEINSDLDSESSEDEDAEIGNIILCQYEKVSVLCRFFFLAWLVKGRKLIDLFALSSYFLFPVRVLAISRTLRSRSLASEINGNAR